jgi:hypothetical protein
MPRLKNDVPNSTRTKVLTAQECAYCGDLLGPFEVDHVRPLSRGGTNNRANLACACVSCNTQKSNHLLHEWRQWRTANGMSWPPIATHGTEPVHYRSRCQTCMRRASGMRDNAKGLALMHASLTTPHTLEPGAGRVRYRASYSCAVCMTSWQCGFIATTGYYSDCPCGYCTTSRLEAAS